MPSAREISSFIFSLLIDNSLTSLEKEPFSFYVKIKYYFILTS